MMGPRHSVQHWQIGLSAPARGRATCAGLCGLAQRAGIGGLIQADKASGSSIQSPQLRVCPHHRGQLRGTNA